MLQGSDSVFKHKFIIYNQSLRNFSESYESNPVCRKAGPLQGGYIQYLYSICSPSPQFLQKGFKIIDEINGPL